MNGFTISARHWWTAIVSLLLSFVAIPAQSTNCIESPIVLDLFRNGIDLGQKGVGVRFDNNADGFKETIQWVRPGGDEAFLAIDRNGNGVVDNGSELFGEGTPLLQGGTNAPNGFVALAQYDSLSLGGNEDGRITDRDSIWNQLWIWLDSNADGVSTPSEMRPISEYSIASLPIIPKVRNFFDDAGNYIPYFGLATTTSTPRLMLVVDVFFVVLSR